MDVRENLRHGFLNKVHKWAGRFTEGRVMEMKLE